VPSLKKEIRYKVYFEVLNHYSSRVGEFIEYLRLSERDFDQDRRVIQSEADRLGLDTVKDDSIFKSSERNQAMKKSA
jgi:hypothetical protein